MDNRKIDLEGRLPWNEEEPDADPCARNICDVCNASVVSNMAPSEEEQDRKIVKDNTRGIHEWMQKNSPLKDTGDEVTAFVLWVH